MSQIVPPFHIMAKPVCGVCNLDCEYCYYTSKPRQLYGGTAEFMMSDDVLQRYTREYLEAAPAQAEVGWQGGEPLLAGKGFFRKALELQRRHCRADQKVVNAVQTNGTLIDDEWAELFAENDFLVGLSLDGPPQWHDHYRRDRAGKGTFHRAWAGLELLRKHNVQFNVLVTLNARNAPHGGDVYRYFVNRGIHWLQFIPILEKDHAGRPREFSCTARQFGQFMLDVLGLWLDKHLGVVSVRLIDSVVHSIVHGEASLCCNARRCANAYVLEWNGDLYACDHFVRREWLIGNIMKTPLIDLLRSPRLEEFAALKTDLPAACRDCEFLRYCNAGCPKHHIPDAASGAPGRVNHFCEGYKMFFREGLPELERIAASLKSGRPPQPRSRGQGGASDSRPAPPVGAVGRNDPCPCGSGRKYKHCCGRT